MDQPSPNTELVTSNKSARLLMEKLVVIKIGGNIIDDEAKLEVFLKTYATVGGNKILVHG